MKLHNLINPELELTVENHAVKIEEQQTQTDTLKEVKITQLPENVFVFSMDKKEAKICKGKETCSGNQGKCRNHFLNEQNDRINKVCDGIIFYYENNYLDLFFCELKSQKLKVLQYETQLINTKLFVDYLFILFEQFYKDEDIQIRQIKYILFHIDRKRPTQTDKALRNKVKIENPSPTIEEMQHYPETQIVKYPLQKTMYNHVAWKDLVSERSG
ncbi:MAG: hypothetical protein ABFS56_35485 [Pseudomonadota bacterium]